MIQKRKTMLQMKGKKKKKEKENKKGKVDLKREKDKKKKWDVSKTIGIRYFQWYTSIMQWY